MTRRFTGSRTHPELYLHRAQFQDTSRFTMHEIVESAFDISLSVPPILINAANYRRFTRVR
jgi:hypothetical protein